MKNLFLFCSVIFWMPIPSFSQNETIVAYYHKEKDFSNILLLDCNVGYSYTGPHLFGDEIFLYEIKGNNLIRTFDKEHSLRERVDTLIINKKWVQDINGLFLKKVSLRKRNKLIEKYIYPTADIGSFQVFLERTSTCKDKKS